jgi:hypothetical protein
MDCRPPKFWLSSHRTSGLEVGTLDQDGHSKVYPGDDDYPSSPHTGFLLKIDMLHDTNTVLYQGVNHSCAELGFSF